MQSAQGGWTYPFVQFLRSALLVLVLIFPVVAGDFWRFFCFQMVVAAYLAISFDLAYSYGRILSFAQGLFFAVGAYAAVNLATAAPWGFALVVFGSVACGMFLGAAIGVVLVRMEGHNPTIATVILASIGLLAGNALSRYTGGEDGLSLATQFVGVGPF
ncbi:MAG: ABC transporter permease subunit, partial [Burkholderiales bacterium]